MNNITSLTCLLAALVGTATAQTEIDSIDLSGSTLTTIHVGPDSYSTLVQPTSVVDNKAGTDYIHVAAAPPASLLESIGSLDIHHGSLNHSFEVQFGQTLFGTTLVFLMVNHNDDTVNDVAIVYPIDAAGNRIGNAQATLNFTTFGVMPLLDTALYNRTTNGGANGTLTRVLAGAVFTLDDLGIGGLAGTQGLEFVTTTLDPQEIGLARAGSLDDPVLLQDVDTADTDLAFGTVFQTGGMPAETPVRTVRYVNAGPTQDLQVDAMTASPDFTITDIAVNGTGGQVPPFVLGVGDSIEVSVKGAPSQTGPEPTLGTVEIDTDENTQDKTLTASATVLGEGDRMNPNPAFLFGGGGASNWSQDHARITPGLTPGSDNAVRLYGTGDTSGETVGQANQAASIPDGASDFEAVSVFTVVDDFSTYAGVSADGGFADRMMQYMLLATDTTVFNGNTLTGADTGNVLVNLTYLPDGNSTGGTPGFYVYNGLTSSWDLAIATSLAGSTDLNGDGVLDPGAGDTVEAYRLSIQGSGFGAPGASYEVTVSTLSGGGLTATQSSGPLTTWHGTSGESGTLASHSFTTGDRSDSNSFGGIVTPFWVDYAALFYDAQPDASLSIIGLPGIIISDGDISSTGSGPLAVRNDGLVANLSVTAFNFDDASFSVVQGLPVAVIPGGVSSFDIEWNSSASAPYSAARGSAEIESSDPGANPTVDLVAGLTTSASLNPNFDFEALGADPDGDTETFSFWNEGTNAQDVPGLLAGSTTAAHVNGNSMLGTAYFSEAPIWSGGEAWMAQAVFAIGGTTNRVFNFKVREELGGEPYAEINIRYEGSKWQVFNGIPGGGGAWVDLIDMTGSPLVVSVDEDGNGSLDDVGDVKVPYQLRISGTGWDGVATPTFDFEVLDAAGGSLGSVTGRTELLSGFTVDDVPTNGPNYLEIRNTGSEFWVDDAVIAIVDASPGVKITSVSGGPGGFVINYDAGGAAVNIERSAPGLTGFSDIATGETSGTYTDPAAPAGGAYYRVYVP